jgi:hypothetical protein
MFSEARTLSGIAATAARIANLDQVITVDMSTANLAGAMACQAGR